MTTIATVMQPGANLARLRYCVPEPSHLLRDNSPFSLAGEEPWL